MCPPAAFLLFLKDNPLLRKDFSKEMRVFFVSGLLLLAEHGDHTWPWGRHQGGIGGGLPFSSYSLAPPGGLAPMDASFSSRLAWLGGSGGSSFWATWGILPCSRWTLAPPGWGHTTAIGLQLILRARLGSHGRDSTFTCRPWVLQWETKRVLESAKNNAQLEMMEEA